MKRFRLLCVLLAILSALPSCATRKETNPSASKVPAQPKPSLFQICLGRITNLIPKKHRPPAAMPPQWTGVIRMVNSAENFVLVESGAMSSVIPGETYLAVAKGVETASLKMTSLKNPPFLIADIISGTPSPGDKIYLPQPPAASPTPTPKPTSKPKPTPKPTLKTKPSPHASPPASAPSKQSPA